MTLWHNSPRLNRRRNSPRSRQRRHETAPFEVLEERRVMSTTTITVTTTADTTVADVETGPQDSNGKISLRSAIEYADNNPGPMVIDIPYGTYNLTQGGMNLGNAAVNADLNITIQGITPTGAPANPQSVVIDQTSATRLFVETSPPGGLQLTFANLMLEGGQTPNNGSTTGGSCMVLGNGDSSSATINNCIIANNVSHNAPGAIEFENGGSLTVTNTVFENNQTTGSNAFGAAIDFDETEADANGNAPTGNFLVSNCTFIGNVAASVGGGAIEADNEAGGGSMTIQNSTFLDNSVVSTVYNGGAVMLTTGTLGVFGCVFYGNTSSNGNTGVVQASTEGTGLILANNDWWGGNGAPGTNGGETIAGNVSCTEWLTLTLTSEFPSISTNSAVLLTAEVLYDTVYGLGSTPVGGTAMDGMNVTFNAGGLPGVSVGPSGGTISNGVVNVNLLTGSTAGADSPSVILDSSVASTTVNIDQPPSVTTQPTNVAITPGQTATFTAAASGIPGPSVQWMVSSNGGTSFSPVSNGTVSGATYSGATTNTLTITNATPAIDGYKYEAVFSNGGGTATSNPATLDDVNVTVNPTTLTAGQINQSYSQTLTASGGTPPYGHFTVASGSLPTGLTLTSAGLLSGTPTVAGTFNFTINATDSTPAPGPYTGGTSYTLTINQPPSITSTVSTTFTEGVPSDFTVTTGADFPTPTTLQETGSLPTGVTFVDNGNGTATLSGTPAFGSSGTYDITITANNGVSPNATQMFALVVQPALSVSSADTDTFTTGTSGTFTVTTTTYIGGAPTLVLSGTLPSGVVFVNNGDGTATLSGTPAVGSGGSYPVIITASNGKAPNAVQDFTLVVDEAPRITSSSAETFAVGQAGTFSVTTAHDFPGATALTETGSLPAGVTFVDNGDGTATLAGTPATGSGGVYNLTISAANGVDPEATQSFTLTVNEAPAFTSASTGSFALDKADTFTVTTAHDYPASTSLTESGTLPSGLSFVDNGNGTATISGTPAVGTNGIYTVTLTASNGIAPNATQTFTLDVDPEATFLVGSSNTLDFSAPYNITGTNSLTTSSSLPTGLSYVDNGNGTATISGTPSTGTGGTYPLTVTASNGTIQETEIVLVTVDEPPSISSANNTTFTVGTAGTFTVDTGHDFPANAALSETGLLPTGVTFVDNGNGTATLSGTPVSGMGGIYNLTITAANGVSPEATQSFTLTVDEAATITSANTTSFVLGTAGTFTVTTGHDYPSGTTLHETGTLPSGVTFVDNGNGTATLAGTPAASTAGAYTITITASNGVSPTASQTFTLDVDQAPSINSASNTTFTVGSAGTFSVTTSAGFPAPAFTETGALPSGVTFVDNGNGTATLAGTPAAGTGGTYSFTITAANGTLPNATQSFTLTVDEAPQINSAASATFDVGASGTFTVTTAHDYPAATSLSETGALPSGVTFVDNGNGTATLAGTPAANTSGTYNITITAANGVTPNATQSFTLTVYGAPSITSAASTTFTAGSAGTFTVTTGPDYPADTAITETGALPTGVTFVDNGNGTATLAGTPAAGTGGTYSLSITAANGTLPNATQTFTLTVNEAPSFTSAASTTFDAGVADTFTVTTAHDYPASTTLSESGALPSGVTFVDNGNGTATLAGTPANNATGAYDITVTAHNGTSPDATQSFVLNVGNSADLSVTLTAASSSAVAGSLVTYTLQVNNGGPTRAENVVVGLPLTGLTVVSQTQTAGTAFSLSASGSSVSDTLSSLASGASATFTIVARLSASATNATKYTNTATVSSSTNDPNPANNSSSAAVTAVNAGAAVMTDPFNPAASDLIVGTSATGNDNIQVVVAAGGGVTVTLNGHSLGSFHPTGRIVLYAGSGNDILSVSQSVGIESVLFAGSGTDVLQGGGGDDILVGGTGRDVLTGGPNENVIIGGTGLSRLQATGSSLMIGGTTIYDANETALQGILAEWADGGLPLATRISNLRNGIGDGGPMLNTSTISLNDVADQLIDSGAIDWFWSVAGSSTGPDGPTGVLNEAAGSQVN